MRRSGDNAAIWRRRDALETTRRSGHDYDIINVLMYCFIHIEMYYAYFQITSMEYEETVFSL